VPSTRRRRRQPESKPEFFIDRDLGRYKVPQAVREMGFVVHPLYEVYPDAEEGTEDPDWIADSAARGWIVLCRDKLRHPGERPAIERHRARVFRVARSAKNSDQQIEYIGNNIHRITQRARRPGPFIYRIDRNRIEKMWPKEE